METVIHISLQYSDISNGFLAVNCKWLVNLTNGSCDFEIFYFCRVFQLKFLVLITSCVLCQYEYHISKQRAFKINNVIYFKISFRNKRCVMYIIDLATIPNNLLIKKDTGFFPLLNIIVFKLIKELIPEKMEIPRKMYAKKIEK